MQLGHLYNPYTKVEAWRAEMEVWVKKMNWVYFEDFCFCRKMTSRLCILVFVPLWHLLNQSQRSLLFCWLHCFLVIHQKPPSHSWQQIVQKVILSAELNCKTFSTSVFKWIVIFVARAKKIPSDLVWSGVTHIRVVLSPNRRWRQGYLRRMWPVRTN